LHASLGGVSHKSSSLHEMAQQQQQFVQISPLVGEVVAVAPGQQQPNENPAAQKFYGEWSSDARDCFTDFWVCCPSFFCLPFYSVYQQSMLFPKRLGQLQLPVLGPVGGSQFAKYAVAVFVIVLVSGSLSRNFMEKGTQAVEVEGRTKIIEVMKGTPTSELLSTLAGLIDFFWLWLVYKGVAARFSVQEDDCTSFFKLLCCRCCAMTQVYRHVQDFDRCNQGLP